MSVRWDAVAKGNAFWSSRKRPDKPVSAPQSAAAGAPVEVQVWLFGKLAGPELRNPLILQFSAGCALREVVGELGHRIGPDFLRKVVSESGELFNICRVFLDGTLIKDMATPICSGGAPATVEIIVLQEIEGG
jgi:hypothetical protein